MLDTSALMAVLLGEPESAACAAVLSSEARLLISAGTLAEALIVAGSRGIGIEMATLVAEGSVEVVPVTAITAARVAEAYAAWGRGHHPAGLNFGDCFAYALAHETSYPLLYVGQDFAKTDVAAAVQGPAQRT
ncbi:type II toxin-antitoxin system VapC family toxin [Paracoccus sp. (in: a-proteobacteria)]|uniref:type II toxin-antitoxin system VapC family toxin n=1 Tax=Paracoccus sp. TaxID=267 RepID=UPI0026E01713|nr:type II toxin-antitoxin system VapC family toxin [Paracoccus sp. (in: a-proteobacteria)]MDO5371309.1 type II toxin-antitoxin system VapC family toxin [Paracoccus sp. (in: a-proteobacteria)]